jgi:dsRNA-specific ribonuclease
MKQYASAFTSELVDENNNYQICELLGDLSANKFIGYYILERFPQLNCSEGVKVVARLRINYGSKNCFYKIADDLGFWDFISATNEKRYRQKKSLLEDVLEAFLGTTESLMDNKKMGLGYAVVYKILKGIFDEIEISLKYEDLYDAKTRLKELFDMCGEKLGSLVYEEKKGDTETLVSSFVYRVDKESRKKVLIGTGSASLKADAQQNGAMLALENLAKQGYVKKPPGIYTKFSGVKKDEKTTSQDVLRWCENDVKKINDQFHTRGKSKFQNNYTSTVLGMYCRKRDYSGIKEALKLGANPNILDSEGLSCVDSLLIGEKNDRLIKKVIKKFMKGMDQLEVQESVYENYYALFGYEKSISETSKSKIVFHWRKELLGVELLVQPHKDASVMPKAVKGKGIVQNNTAKGGCINK